MYACILRHFELSPHQFVDNTAAYIIEESVIDPRRRTMVTFTKNITLNKFMTVAETCEYSQSADNPSWCVHRCSCRCMLTGRRTHTSSHAAVSSSVYSISSIVEKFGIERYRANIKKARKALQYTLDLCFPVSAHPSATLSVSHLAGKRRPRARQDQSPAQQDPALRGGQPQVGVMGVSCCVCWGMTVQQTRTMSRNGDCGTFTGDGCMDSVAGGGLASAAREPRCPVGKLGHTLTWQPTAQHYHIPWEFEAALA